METYTITPTCLRQFCDWLREGERSAGTIEKYLRDVRAFADWLGARALCKETVALWKEHLCAAGLAPATINSMLAAVRQFLLCHGRGDCCVKYLSIQRRAFRENRRELTREDYAKLLATANSRGQARLALLLETLAATGVRVSEVRYLTVEAGRCGYAEIALKGKLRRILLPRKLCRKLLRYAKKQNITRGEIFLTKRGKSWGRKQIWAQLKRLAEEAGVEASRVFPHNFRHLFAVTFYRVSRDISKLADVLGHTSIETTRIYLRTSGKEHAQTLDRLGFVT